MPDQFALTLPQRAQDCAWLAGRRARRRREQRAGTARYACLDLLERSEKGQNRSRAPSCTSSDTPSAHIDVFGADARPGRQQTAARSCAAEPRPGNAAQRAGGDQTPSDGYAELRQADAARARPWSSPASGDASLKSGTRRWTEQLPAPDWQLGYWPARYRPGRTRRRSLVVLLARLRAALALLLLVCR
ncbi:MAG: hypothetical protein MZW92_46125 [Comamonadaceae bacterium]|nr:hypothetical protein [Comamonadaceae bacterium]